MSSMLHENWFPREKFSECVEAEIHETLRISEAQMKKKYSNKKTSQKPRAMAGLGEMGGEFFLSYFQVVPFPNSFKF